MKQAISDSKVRCVFVLIWVL